MNKKLTHLFDQMHADESIKQKTLQAVQRKTSKRKRWYSSYYRWGLSVIACMALLFFGIQWFYFTPVMTISIDINPSIELEINRFDQVISATSYNTDGEQLLASLNLKHQDYEQAIQMITESETIASLLDKDEVLAIVVVSDDDETGTAVMKKIQACTDPDRTYCSYANQEEVEDAHALGLSYGKYIAYMQLKQYDDTLTIEEVQQMTMREIHEQIDHFCSDEKDDGTHGKNKGQGKQYGKS